MSSYLWEDSVYLNPTPSNGEFAYVTGVLKIQWNSGQQRWDFVENCGAAVYAGEGGGLQDHAATHEAGGGDALVLENIAGDLPAARITGLNSVATTGSATDLGTGTLSTARIGTNAVNFDKLQQISTDSILGRDTAGTGSIEVLGLGGGVEIVGGGLQLAQIGGGGNDLLIGAGGASANIIDGKVTNGKLGDVPTATIKGRVAGGSGPPTDLTTAQATTLIDVATSTLKGAVPASGGGTTNFLRADMTWAAPPAGGGGSATTVEKDLGSTPTWRGRFTITDAAIGPTSKVLVWQAPGPYTGKGTRADEAELAPVQIIMANPGSGSAVVDWQTPPMITTIIQGQSGGDGGRANTTVLGAGRRSEHDDIGVRRIGMVRGNFKFTYMVL
jgi:hypothetical protein